MRIYACSIGGRGLKIFARALRALPYTPPPHSPFACDAYGQTRVETPLPGMEPILWSSMQGLRHYLFYTSSADIT